MLSIFYVSTALQRFVQISPHFQIGSLAILLPSCRVLYLLWEPVFCHIYDLQLDYSFSLWCLLRSVSFKLWWILTYTFFSYKAIVVYNLSPPSQEDILLWFPLKVSELQLLCLSLQSILNWFLCLVWGKSWGSFFTLQIPSYSSNICWKDFPFPH